MTSLLSEFIRANRKTPCPICGRAGWCLIDRENPSDPARVLCQRIESDLRWGEAGWLHQLRISHRVPAPRTREFCVGAGRDGRWATIADRARAQLSTPTRQAFAEQLGVTATALERLEVGMAHGDLLATCGVYRASYAWTFPMRDDKDRIIGIRLRLLDGRKLSAKGCRTGLLVPRGLDAPAERLVIVEGPTDAAALLGLGFAVVGRPSCNGGDRLLCRLVARLRPRQVVVVGDSDAPGVAGASRAARSIRAYCRDVRVALPPVGLKDVREWVRSGGSRDEVDEVLDRAEQISLSVSVAHGSRCS